MEAWDRAKTADASARQSGPRHNINDKRIYTMFDTLLITGGVLTTLGIAVASFAGFDGLQERWRARVTLRVIGSTIAVLGFGTIMFSLYSGKVSPMPSNGQPGEKPNFISMRSGSEAAMMYESCPNIYAQITHPNTLKHVSGADFSIVEDAEGNRYSYSPCRVLERDAIIVTH